MTIVLLVAAAALAPAAGPLPQAVAIRPAVATAAVGNDADDPAIWVHSTQPDRSLIIATNKVRAPDGALVVFDLEGRIVQTVRGLDRPNNVDVEYGFRLGGRDVDIVVTTERLRQRLRVFAMDPGSRQLADVSGPAGIPVLARQRGRLREPMGVGLYRRPGDGAVFAILSPKDGPVQGYLWQYRLHADKDGRIAGTFVRRFGAFSGNGLGRGRENEIEAIAVDDALGYVYYADEEAGLRKYHADPDHPDAARELAFFGREGYERQREGLAIYGGPDGTGYLVSTDQVPGNSRFLFYRREGTAADPHDHREVVAVITGGAGSTDGIEITARALGGRFPRGLFVAMNSGARNFLLFDWRDVERLLPRSSTSER